MEIQKRKFSLLIRNPPLAFKINYQNTFYKIELAHKYVELRMSNSLEGIKKWFFELIEDAVGEETMKKYNKEMEDKNKLKNGEQ